MPKLKRSQTQAAPGGVSSRTQFSLSHLKACLSRRWRAAARAAGWNSTSFIKLRRKATVVGGRKEMVTSPHQIKPGPRHGKQRIAKRQTKKLSAKRRRAKKN